MAKKKVLAAAGSAAAAVDLVAVSPNLYWRRSTGEALVLFPAAVIEDGTPQGIASRVQLAPVWASSALFFGPPAMDRNGNPVGLGPAALDTVRRVAEMVAERAPVDTQVHVYMDDILLERPGYEVARMSASLLARYLVQSITYDHPRLAIELHPDPILGEQIAAALASVDEEGS